MADPYATGVLIEVHHHRLVADLDNFARDAGIQPRWIWTALADTCGPEAVEYVRWAGMFQHAGKHPRYRHVEVCESWHKFENFVADTVVVVARGRAPMMRPAAPKATEAAALPEGFPCSTHTRPTQGARSRSKRHPATGPTSSRPMQRARPNSG